MTYSVHTETERRDEIAALQHEVAKMMAERAEREALLAKYFPNIGQPITVSDLHDH